MGETSTDASERAEQRRGPAPRFPKPNLPDGVAPREANAKVRRLIAGGPTREELQAQSADPELAALAAVEAKLFPRSISGTTSGSPGFLPAVDRSTEVFATGLPPTAQTLPATRTEKLPTIHERWMRSLRMPDLPVRMDARVIKYLRFFHDSTRGQALARSWAKRSGRYAPALRTRLQQAGLPQDLVWLSLVESAHNPTIRSHAGAVGLWQFMPATARIYGLTVDRWVDERLDPERSTTAAIRHLSDLNQRFGNWHLAMAAYNMGAGGLSRAMRRFNTNDYWRLSDHEGGLPWETTLYVPKILALALVMNNKQVFGLADIVPDPPGGFDTISVESGRTLSDVARAAELPLAQLIQYNPQLLARRTPPGTDHHWRVHLPLGKGQAARARLTQQPNATMGLANYVSRFGDTLEAVAADHGVSESVLERLNHWAAGEVLQPETTLLVPRKAATKRKPAPKPVVVVPLGDFRDPSQRQVFYRVRHGDTLDAIAAAFGVTPARLMLFNDLDPSAKLQKGLVLQVFVGVDRSLTHVRHMNLEDVQVLVAGSDDFYDHSAEQKGRLRLVIAAKQGDTLSRIGRRYGVSARAMEQINRRARRDALVAGQKVVVYTKRRTTAQLGDHPYQSDPVALPDIQAVHPELLPGSEPAPQNEPLITSR